MTADRGSLLWGRQFTEWFHGGRADSSFARMTEGQMHVVGGAAKMLEFLAQVQQHGGNEEAVLSEEVKPDSAGARKYVRRARFSNVPDPVIRVVWVLNADHRIAGFGIRPEESTGS